MTKAKVKEVAVLILSKDLRSHAPGEQVAEDFTVATAEPDFHANTLLMFGELARDTLILKHVKGKRPTYLVHLYVQPGIDRGAPPAVARKLAEDGVFDDRPQHD